MEPRNKPHAQGVLKAHSLCWTLSPQPLGSPGAGHESWQMGLLVTLAASGKLPFSST